MTEIIVADDQIEVLDMLIRSLRDDTRTIHAFSTGREALTYLQQHPNQIGLAILDLDYGPNEPDGLEILPQMLESVPDLPIIMLTGQGTIDTAVAALRLGATDFIEKDFYIEDKIELSLEKLDRVYQALKENAQLRAEVQDLGRENQFYRDEFGKRYQIIGSSPKLQQILQRAQTVAPIPRPALITGEPGTGKELVAAAIHYGSDRKDRPFVKVNCAAIADQLLEKRTLWTRKRSLYRARQKPARANLKPRVAVPYSSMKLAIPRPNFSKTYCAPLNIAKYSAWAVRHPSLSMCALLPPQIPISKRKLPKADSVRTSTTDCALRSCTCPHCANAAKTFPR